MRRLLPRTLVALVAATFVLVTPAVAFADGFPLDRGPTSSTTTTTTTTLISANPDYSSCTTSSGTNSPPTTSERGLTYPIYQCESRLYKEAASQIQQAFRNAVSAARAQYRRALHSAHSNSERSAALQVMEAAVIQAATVRAAALTALGVAPTWHRHD